MRWVRVCTQIKANKPDLTPKEAQALNGQQWKRLSTDDKNTFKP